eukprot:scaffold1020_cov182-Alexandrium_tamarense.AAC.22
MNIRLLCSALVALQLDTKVSSFSSTQHHNAASRSSHQPVHLQMVASGMGMGMGMTTKGKKGGASKGMGKMSAKNDKKSAAPFDVSKALIKSEKLYEELMSESTKAYNAAEEGTEGDLDITTEYVIAARGKQSGASTPIAASASDWVPVAQIVITRPVHAKDNDDGGFDSSVRASISYYCREINYAACLGSPSTFKSLPRNAVEYSVEPIDSFFRHVYEEVIEGKNRNNFVEGDAKVSMTKTKAREILGLEAGCKDAVVIKQAYKRKAFERHPDRFVAEERTQDDIDTSPNQFLSVKMAYETLTSGVRGTVKANGDSQSWYESLGGKSRTEFLGPIELMSVEKAGALCNKAFKSAVAGLDPDLTMAFVARNQAAR